MKALDNEKLIRSLVLKMFDCLDNLNYNTLNKEVLADKLFFDIYPTHIEAKERTSDEVCDIFNSFSQGLDASNRLIGEIIVSIEDEKANVFTSTTVTHFKKKTKKGNTRELNGDYHLVVTKNNNEWSISSFIYRANQVYGNVELE